MSLIPFEGAIEAFLGIVNKYIPDVAAQAAAKAAITEQMLTIATQEDSQQADINKVEAASASLFVSGWRPCLGWICDCIFAEHYLIAPLFKFIGSCWHGDCAEPKFDINEINLVLWALLGNAGLRTIDKSVSVIMKSLK